MRAFDYDFGLTTQVLIWLGIWSSKNIEVYGTEKPPVIDSVELSIPVKFYYAEADYVISVEVRTFRI